MAFGIKLIQNGVVLADGTSVHPAPIAIDPAVLCYLSFTGTTLTYDWVLTAPADDPGSVISSKTSPGPTFVGHLDNADYSVSLTDDSFNVYVLDIQTPTAAPSPGTGSVAYATTIAGLRLLNTASSTETVIVRCYALLGDGGGGTFCWNATNNNTTRPDDGGVVIVPTSLIGGTGCWERQLSVFERVNVKWFGAVGDGVTNDRTAIQSVIAYVLSRTRGGCIYAPQNNYLITGTGGSSVGLDFSNSSATKRITLEGDGDDATIFTFASCEAGFYATPAKNVTFRGIGTAQTGAGLSKAFYLTTGTRAKILHCTIGQLTRTATVGLMAGVYLDGMSHVLIDDVTISGDSGAVAQQSAPIIGYTAGCQHVLIKGLTVLGATAQWDQGVFFFNGQNVKICDSTLIYNPARAEYLVDTGVYGTACYSTSLVTNTGSDFQVDNCYIEGCSGSGVFSQASLRTRVRGVTLVNVVTLQADPSLLLGAISIQGQVDQEAVISDVTIRTCPKNGIALQGNRITVTNVIAQNCGENAILLGDCMTKIVIDNVVAEKCKRILLGFGTSFVRDCKLHHITGSDLSQEGMLLPTLSTSEIKGVRIRNSVNSGVHIAAGDNLMLDDIQVSHSTSEYGFDIASTRTTMTNCGAKACHAGAILWRTAGTQGYCVGNDWSMNGDAPSITGSVDLTGLSMASLAGQTMTLKVDGGASQVVTCGGAQTYSQLLDFIKQQTIGIYVHLSSSNHLVLTSENGGNDATTNTQHASIETVSGSALATLGLATTVVTGGAPSTGTTTYQPTDLLHYDNRCTPVLIERIQPKLGGVLRCRLACPTSEALTGLAARDGVTPAEGDRVFVWVQGSPNQNGVYIAQAGSWQRAPELSNPADFEPGMTVIVEEGTLYASSEWYMETIGPYNVGTTNLTFRVRRIGQSVLAQQALIGAGTGALATVGHVRLPNTGSVYARDNADSSDVRILYYHTDDKVYVPGFYSKGDGSRFTWLAPRVGWDTSVNSPTIAQDDNTTNSATAQATIVRGANATGTTSVGGELDLRGGTGTSTNAGVSLKTTGGTVNFRSDDTGLGFFAHATAAKPTVTGIKVDAVAGSIVAALAALGLITDSTT